MGQTQVPNPVGFDIESVPADDRDRVRALIPDPALVDVYRSRTIDGVRDLDAAAGHMAEWESLLITGPASVGKTLFGRAVAAYMGLPFATVNVSPGQVDPTTIWGQLMIDPDDPTGRGLRWVDSDLMLTIRYGGVRLFDEINMAHEAVMAGFNSLTDDRKSVTVSAHLGETVRAAFPGMTIGTMNPPGGAAYRGTRELNGATADRFVHWVWDYDPEVESDLITSPALLDLARNIRAMPDVTTPLGTRALMSFERSATRLGMAYAVGRLVDRFRESERAGIRRAVEIAAVNIGNDLGIGDGGTE